MEVVEMEKELKKDFENKRRRDEMSRRKMPEKSNT